MTHASSASIIGVAVLVKKLEGKSFVFNTQFFVNKTQTVIAALQYFNWEEYRIDDLATYMVIANVRLFILA